MMKTLMLLIVLVSLTITTARLRDDEGVSVRAIISDIFPGFKMVVEYARTIEKKKA